MEKAILCMKKMDCRQAHFSGIVSQELSSSDQRGWDQTPVSLKSELHIRCRQVSLTCSFILTLPKNCLLHYTGSQSFLSPFTLHRQNCVRHHGNGPPLTPDTARQQPTELHGVLQIHVYLLTQFWEPCKSLLPLTSTEYQAWIFPAGITKVQMQVQKDESRLWHKFAPLISLLGVIR